MILSERNKPQKNTRVRFRIYNVQKQAKAKNLLFSCTHKNGKTRMGTAQSWSPVGEGRV